MQQPNPIRPTDDEARRLAQGLLHEARFAALATLNGSGVPTLARVAFGTDEQGRPLLLVSDIAAHTQAVLANPACALLVGEPGDKGDPLTHPRLTLEGRATTLDKTDTLRARWLHDHPKSKLYIDFADFRFLRIDVDRGFLNGGFGKAYDLTPGDLGLGSPRRRTQA
ncbi:HugZ family protein [Maritimibacter dapengensis]|uniref:Pyridoxamine 5'-phosphate oxidase family protein n=1 Tax=Maritimibacter dapengensis TaxID=2836868 RepID=A0ABS6SYT3_9RHOB|nr:pyridoxamine 5'-phosphate oxidase family protein [Maritimibacter dapengensis]MBV7378139.1 pyridoxamine 5'-phosphate oxidase family protein [Maritimibacter dapengensis]